MQFKKGDRVKHVNNGREGDVIFVHHNGDCSVDFDNGTLTLCFADSLIKIGNFNVDVKELLESQGWTFEDEQDFMTYLMIAKRDLKLVFEALGVDDNARFALKGAQDIENSTALAYDIVRALFDYYLTQGWEVFKFKINDRVRLTTYQNGCVPVGSIGTIVARENVNYCLVDFDDGSFILLYDNLELVKEEDEQ